MQAMAMFHHRRVDEERESSRSVASQDKWGAKRFFHERFVPYTHRVESPRIVSPPILTVSYCYKKIPLAREWLEAVTPGANNKASFPKSWNILLKIYPENTPEDKLPDPPGPTIMSPKLWPAVNQLLKTVDTLEEEKGRPLFSRSDMNDVIAHWPVVNQDHEVTKIDVMVMLHLCRIAMSARSPLPTLQKKFLIIFLLSQMKGRYLKTSLFEFIKVLNAHLPVVSLSDIPKRLIDKDSLKQALLERCGSNGKTIQNHFLHSLNWELDDTPPIMSDIDITVWRVARSFLNIWENDHECDLASEFNIGEDDMLNAPHYSLYLSFLFDHANGVNEKQKNYLALLLDTVIVMKNVTLTILGKPCGWRTWLELYDPRHDCLPDNFWELDETPDVPERAGGNVKQLWEPSCAPKRSASYADGMPQPKRLDQGKVAIVERVATGEAKDSYNRDSSTISDSESDPEYSGDTE